MKHRNSEKELDLTPSSTNIMKKIIKAGPQASSFSGISPTKKPGDNELASPAKIKIKDKFAIPSFLDSFNYLTEDDLEILATFEEEQSRRLQTGFQLLYPTKETIETLGPHFDCLRHANAVLW